MTVTAPVGPAAGPPGSSGPVPPVPTPDGTGGRSRLRDRLVVWGSAVATLVVIATVAVLGNTTGGPAGDVDPRSMLTELGRRAVDTFPDAFQSGDSVILATGEGVPLAWSGYVAPEQLDGDPVPLFVRGLVSYASLRPPGEGRGWTRHITHGDRVFVDVGPLSLGCVRPPEEVACSPALLMEYVGRFYVFQSGIGGDDFLEPGSRMQGEVFEAIVGGQRQRLVLGGVGRTGLATVEITLESGDVVQATSVTYQGESTLWWATVTERVRRVVAVDLRRDVADRIEDRS